MYKDKAEAAKNKPAALGEDIDLGKYITPEEEKKRNKGELPAGAKEKMVNVGVLVDEEAQRSGTYIQVDNAPVQSRVMQDGVELMPTSEAVKKYDWLGDYWWQAVAVDMDKYTANVELGHADGYFIRAARGSKTVFPIQACLYMAKANIAQKVHNIIIAEEDSELHIITGCMTSSGDEPGLHMGVSEFYIKPRAKVTFTMIHNWNPEVAVRPRTGAIIEEGGTFISNYVIMKPVRTLQTYPTARCIGDNATVRFNSVMVAGKGSHLDSGARVFLNAEKARTEIVSRAITTGGEIIARGYIEGNAPEVKGHLECKGLILEGGGMIHAIPELKGNLPGIDLYHEAAVGKIAEEEVEYLMSRGLTRNEATSTIVRGFLRVDIEGLPPLLNEELKRAVEASEQDVM